MTASGRLGAAATALVLAGGLLSHALDEQGLLPGVREAARVRELGERGAARPLLLLGCLAVSVAVGALVARLDRRDRGRVGPRALLALVVAGQATLFASFEVVARLAAGHGVAEVFVEPNFAAGFVVQVAIGAAFVTLLLLAARALVVRAPRAATSLLPSRRLATAHHPRPVPSRRPAGVPRGRAPPYGVSPSATETNGKDHHADPPARGRGGSTPAARVRRLLGQGQGGGQEGVRPVVRRAAQAR